jgi:hypothetical protein
MITPLMTPSDMRWILRRNQIPPTTRSNTLLIWKIHFFILYSLRFSTLIFFLRDLERLISSTYNVFCPICFHEGILFLLRSLYSSIFLLIVAKDDRFISHCPCKILFQKQRKQLHSYDLAGPTHLI